MTSEASGSASVAAGRARLSCLPCRKRKSRCDEGAPCSTCLQRGTAESCRLPTEGDALKRPAPSTNGDHKSKAPKTGNYNGHTAASESRDSLAAESVDTLSEVAAIQESLDRLKHTLQRPSPSLPPREWVTNGPVAERPSGCQRLQLKPPALGGQALEELLALLPSQQDCEVLFEYLFQELDWMILCASPVWILPVWSRFVYGGQITEAEACCIAVHLAVASMMLSEVPHVFYATSFTPSALHPGLRDYVWSMLERGLPSAPGTSPEDCFTWLVALGRAFDYLRFSGQRKPEYWRPMMASYAALAGKWRIEDEQTSFWKDLDPLEREIARGVVWTRFICNRWGSLYFDLCNPSDLRDDKIKVEHPDWKVMSLSEPFRAQTPQTSEHLLHRTRLGFRTPRRRTVRLFRWKDEREIAAVAETQEVTIGLTEHAIEISEYLRAVKVWATAPKVAREGGNDHRKTALLHQAVALCEDAHRWAENLPARFTEPKTLDVNDFFAVREANQASVMQVGVRQAIHAITSVWLEDDAVTSSTQPTPASSAFSDDSSTASRSLVRQIQREAFDNARSMVQQIEMHKIMWTANRSVGFGCWAAYALFYAATTLAIPLVGAAKLQEERRDAQVRLGSLVLPDIYHSADASRDTATKPTPPATASTSAATPTSSSPLTLEEMRSLAPDILRILDALSVFNASPLGKEAQHRLEHLVKAYDIRQEIAPGPAFETKNAFTPFDGSFDSWPPTSQAAAAGGVFAPLETFSDPRGFAALDSLVALDDDWWNKLLASTSGG